MSIKLATNFSRSNASPIDADYIVESGTIGSKSDVSNYIQNLNIAHNGMQIWFRDINLGCIVVDPSTGEYVELGGGGIALVSDSSEETSFVNGLTSDDEGQLIYNQSEDKYKKYDGSSLVESSGQIITNTERQRLIPNVINVDSNNKSEYLQDQTSSGYWEFKFSGTNHDKDDLLGSIIKFNANSLSLSDPIRVILPVTDTSYEVGWHMFTTVIEGTTTVEYTLETGSNMEPFAKFDSVPGYMIAAYNIKDQSGQNNYWQAIGNILDAT